MCQCLENVSLSLKQTGTSPVEYAIALRITITWMTFVQEVLNDSLTTDYKPKHFRIQEPQTLCNKLPGVWTANYSATFKKHINSHAQYMVVTLTAP